MYQRHPTEKWDLHRKQNNTTTTKTTTTAVTTFNSVDAVHEDAHVFVAGHFAFVEEGPGGDDVFSPVAEFLVRNEFVLGARWAPQRA